MAKKKEEETTTSKSIEQTITAIEMAQGKGAIMFGKKKPIPGVEFRSSGCIGLDDILGGGWAKGRIVEIYGPESSGKTTLALHAIAEAQKAGELVAFIDVEHAFDPEYAEALGVDLEKLVFSQPDSGEQALQIAEALCGSVGVIVIDSVSALLPKAEIEKQIGDSTVGRQAGLMSQAMRKFAPLSSKTGTTLIFINQIRMKIGIMFGNPETTSGGNALKFYASQRVDVRRTGGVKEGERVVASKTRAKVVKNKVYVPFGVTEFEIKYGEGIDVMGDLLDRAVERGFVDKAGSWYSCNNKKLGQGKAAVVEVLKKDEGLANSLRIALSKSAEAV